MLSDEEYDSYQWAQRYDDVEYLVKTEAEALRLPNTGLASRKMCDESLCANGKICQTCSEALALACEYAEAAETAASRLVKGAVLAAAAALALEIAASAFRR